MKNFISFIIKKYFQSRARNVTHWKSNQIATQKKIRTHLIQKAQNTEYGKKYDFQNIRSLEDFQAKIPIVGYEQIAPYVERMLQGEKNILWPGKVTRFSKSSGTTNDVSKYIPVSDESLYNNNYKAGKDLYTIFCTLYPASNIFKDNGSTLSLGGSLETNTSSIRVGDISAHLIAEAPSWAELHRAPSRDIALMQHWKDKIPAIIQDTQHKNITHFSGVPTWFVSMIEEMKQKKMFTESLREVWPNLELFIHGAVAFGPYRSIFEEFLPHDDMKYMEVYNASEGFFALQDDFQRRGEMVLLTDHDVFYEFIPMSEYGEKNATVYTLENIMLGIDYACVITTSAGLWRYDIGDTIQFTTRDPFRIKITGRTKHFINIVGEELMVGNADEALVRVCEATGAGIAHYTAGPIFMNKQGKAGHEWVIAFHTAPKDSAQFIALLDQQLCVLNSDYAAKRQDDIALQPLIAHIVSPDIFMQWMEQRGKLGGQHKVPKLSNQRDYIEGVLNLAK